MGAQHAQVVLPTDRSLPRELGLDDDIETAAAQVLGGVARTDAGRVRRAAPALDLPAVEHGALCVLPRDAVADAVVGPPQRQMPAGAQHAPDFLDRGAGLPRPRRRRSSSARPWRRRPDGRSRRGRAVPPRGRPRPARTTYGAEAWRAL